MKRIVIGVTILVAIIAPGFFVSFDGDNRTFVSEVTGETSPFSSDTDGDGLTDSQEINQYDTNPTKADTDGDGLTDSQEINEYDTNPTKADTDRDELNDGQEINEYDTNPTKADTDEDGIEDGKEVHKHGTNPDKVDSDEDGMHDLSEVNRGTDPTSKPECNAGDKNTDSDSDGLTDYEECRLGTNPDNKDTDGDGLTDYEEFRGVTDDGTEISNSNPTHMDLYITVVTPPNFNFSSYSSKVSRGEGSEREQVKKFFSNVNVENPNGQTGINAHFNTVERTDEEIVVSELMDNEEELHQLWNRYSNKKYDDSFVHTLYVVAQVEDTDSVVGYAKGGTQFAVGLPRWKVISHETLHTVLGDIEGSECSEYTTHVCSEDGLMNPKTGPGGNESLSSKTISEIEEDGFSTSD